MKRSFTILTAAFMLLAFLAIPMGMMGQTRSEVTYTFSQYYNANTTLTDVVIAFDDNITGTFHKGTGSTAPQYYTNGTAVRWYAGNTLNITASNATISAIELTYTQKNKTVTTDVGTYDHATGTWSGSASSVTFTVESGSGHNRVSAIKVTYTISGGTPTCATPTFSPAGGTYTQAQNVSISCATEGATIYYTTNNTDPTTSSSVYTEALTISETTTVKAMAAADGYNNSSVASATYTITAPSTIADVRAQGTGSVFTQGVVTSCVGTTGYIQDATAAICVYGTSLTVGDEITVSGTLSTYNGLLEITSPTVSVISNNNTVEPTVKTIAEINEDYAANNALQGWYVTIENATVTAISGQNTTIAQGNNTITVRGISGVEYAVNDVLTLNGNIGCYNAAQIVNPQNVEVQQILEPSVTVTPATINAPAEGANGTLGITYENINDPESFDYYFCDANGGELEEDPDWINAEINYEGDDASISYTIDPNDGEARTAYIKVYTLVNDEEVYAIVTVNQEEYVAPGIEENYMLFTGNLVEGDYLIVYNGKAMNNTTSSNRLQYEEVSAVDDVIITDNAEIVWHIAPSGDYWTIFSADANAYAASTGTKNQATTMADGTDDKALWTVSDNYDFVNKYNSNNNINSYLRNNGTYGFACYGSGTGAALSLYKKIDGNTPSITITPDVANLPAEAAAGEDFIEGTLAVVLANMEVSSFEDFIIQYYDSDENELNGEDEPNWIEVLVAEQDPQIGEGYVVSYLMEENNGSARTAYFTVNAINGDDLVESNLVTINQAGYVAPGGSNDFQLYSGALVEGDYLIVYDDGAMNTTESNYRLQFNNVYPVNDLITTDDAAIIWHIAPSGNYWTIYNAGENAYAASNGNKNQAQMLEDGTDDMALWTVSTIEGTYEFENKARGADGSSNPGNKWLRRNGDFGFACYSTSTGGALSLYKRLDTPVTETYTLTIDGYNDDNIKDGYYLIASPVTVNPAGVAGLTESDFDLYYYDDTQDLEWINYETQDGINADFGNLIPGQGYLYAKKATTENPTYSFNLTGVPYSGNGEIDLIAGWNLVGNPFGQEAEISMDYYAMNQDGSELTPVTASTNVAAMQGVFVYSEEAGTVIFMPAETGTNAGDDKLVLNVTRNRGTVIDRAIVRFGQGGMLPKFQLNENNTKISIVEGETEYAVVRSANEGEMPVSFKASENGRYTISVNAENIEMEYLHLIDNMTGADVDLLATPSYSFEANTTDYTSRFRLVFSANSNDGSSTSSETFAFFNGSNWVVNNEGEAILQVIDMTGRMLSSEQINGSYNKSLNLSAGVYVLRLSNGNVVKTQKVVID